MRKLSSSLFIGAAAFAVLVPAHAVELEQKWQPGQKLGYDMALDGTLNVQTAQDVPVIWAGIPLEVLVHGRGEGQLETLSVDNAGTGTVAVKVPKLNVQAETLGQKVDVKVQDGKPTITLNGKPMNIGAQGTPGANPTPSVAVKITKQGKFAGVENLSAAKPKTEAPANGAPVPLANAIDRTALMQAMVLRAIPALWPGRDVKTGETWDAVVPWMQADGTNAAKPLGQFTLTLKGEETVNGRTLQRVALDGAMKMDAEKLQQVNKGIAETAKAQPQAPRAVVTGAGQQIKGDLWFDAAAGQIHKAELILSSRMASRNQKPGGQTGGESWADFTGTLLLNLKNPA